MYAQPSIGRANCWQGNIASHRNFKPPISLVASDGGAGKVIGWGSVCCQERHRAHRTGFTFSTANSTEQQSEQLGGRNLLEFVILFTLCIREYLDLRITAVWDHGCISPCHCQWTQTPKTTKTSLKKVTSQRNALAFFKKRLLVFNELTLSTYSRHGDTEKNQHGI